MPRAGRDAKNVCFPVFIFGFLFSVFPDIIILKKVVY